jgi:hypothetical protein
MANIGSNYGMNLFGQTKEQQEENKRKRAENTKNLNEVKALNVFPEQMDFEMKTKNPETGKYDKGGRRRSRRRRTRKSKKSKKSRKSRKHRK